MAKNRRQIIFIDPPFQIRFSLFVTLISLAAAAFYPVAIYQLIQSLISELPESERVAQLGTSWKSFFYSVLAYQFFFSVLVFGISLFISHRIAGPVYKTRLYIADLIKGTTWEHFGFRKNDNFKALAEDMNALGQHLAEEGVTSKGSSNVDLSEIVSELEELEGELKGEAREKVKRLADATRSLQAG